MMNPNLQNDENIYSYYYQKTVNDYFNSAKYYEEEKRKEIIVNGIKKGFKYVICGVILFNIFGGK